VAKRGVAAERTARCGGQPGHCPGTKGEGHARKVVSVHYICQEMKHQYSDMKKLLLAVVVAVLMQSCVVSTAAKVVKTAGKVAVGAVKTTVHTIDWTVKKANGKINEDRLDGKWKVAALYKGSFEDYENSKNPENLYQGCSEGQEVYEFKAKKSKFTQYSCGVADPSTFKYTYSWEKDPTTGEKENMVSYGPGYFNVINADSKHLVLEGYFLDEGGTKVRSTCFLEKIK